MFKNDLNNHILIGISICMYMIHGNLFLLPRIFILLLTRRKQIEDRLFDFFHGYMETGPIGKMCLKLIFVFRFEQ
jgi:hypothetical protein